MEDYRLFFELLQVAIENKNSLSRVPCSTSSGQAQADEWGELYSMATRQALTGVCFVGLQRLKSAGEVTIPEALWLKWLWMAAKIQQRNIVVSGACKTLYDRLLHDGFESCVLKGQSNLEYYPEWLQSARTPGDMDIWCRPLSKIDLAVGDIDGKGAHYESFEGKDAVIEYVRQQWLVEGKSGIESAYLHIEAPKVDGVDVEVHLRPSYLHCPWRNVRMQKWFERMSIDSFRMCSDGFKVPSVEFDVVFQLSHIFKHFIEEGIGLRQLLDYYFVLRTLHIEQNSFKDRTQSMAQWAENMGLSVPSGEEIRHTLSKFGMMRFASAVMWVLHEVFGMPVEYMIVPACEKRGKLLLDEILTTGNFGKFDERRHTLTSENVLPRKWVVLEWLIRKNLRLFHMCPLEILFVPWSKMTNMMWRKLRLWRY